MQRLTLNQVATICAIAAVVGPVGVWAWNHFQTVDDAKAHEDRDHRAIARLLYGQSKAETLTLRNRVNDCREKPTIKSRERPACDQYQQEYDESKARTEELYRGLRK